MSDAEEVLKILKEVNAIVGSDLDVFKAKALDVIQAHAGPISAKEASVFAELVVEGLKLMRHVISLADINGIRE